MKVSDSVKCIRRELLGWIPSLLELLFQCIFLNLPSLALLLFLLRLLQLLQHACGLLILGFGIRGIPGRFRPGLTSFTVLSVVFWLDFCYMVGLRGTWGIGGGRRFGGRWRLLRLYFLELRKGSGEGPFALNVAGQKRCSTQRERSCLVVQRILRTKFGGKLGTKNTSEDRGKRKLGRSDTRGSHYHGCSESALLEVSRIPGVDTWCRG